MNVSATLTLEQLIDTAITMRLRSVWTVLPGRLTGVSASGMVNVQPIPNDVQDGQQVALPEVTVRACLPAQTAGIVYPLSVGDVGLLLFSARPIGALVQSGTQAVDLQDTRTHSLSDGFFLPVGAFTEPPAGLPIARDGDTVSIGTDWLTWFQTVGTAIGTPPPSQSLPPVLSIGTVSGSSNVEAT